MHDPRTRYADYIACLNERRWEALDAFVADAVVHNGRTMDRAGYAELIAGPAAAAPDLRFAIATLVVDDANPETIAARLLISATPQATFLGLPASGAQFGSKKLRFAEHVFYRLHENRIVEVWSLLDHAALEAQVKG